MDKEALKKIEEPIINSPKEVQIIISRVLDAEKDKLYMDKPRVVDDIVDIIKEVIKHENNRTEDQ